LDLFILCLLLGRNIYETLKYPKKKYQLLFFLSRPTNLLSVKNNYYFSYQDRQICYQ